MERLRLRAFAVAGLLLVAGVILHAMPRPDYGKKDEAFMEKAAPAVVGDFRFTPSQENPMCSYKVDENTYTVLNPFGAVGRIYSHEAESYDVLLISGNDKNSFHDNRICFQAQGYTIIGESQEIVSTERGDIPVTIVEVNHDVRGKIVAAMFYKGPRDKWYPTNYNLTWAMFMEQLRMGDNLDSTFFRVIPLHSNPDKKLLLEFIKKYVVAAQKSSSGFF